MKWFSSLKSQKEHTATCKVEPEKIVEHQSEAIRRSFESSANKISEGLAYCEFCEMSYEVNENYTISKHLKTVTHMNNVEKKNNSWSNSITSSRTKTEKIVEPNNFELGQQSEEILTDPLADDSMEISDPEHLCTYVSARASACLCISLHVHGELWSSCFILVALHALPS